MTADDDWGPESWPWPCRSCAHARCELGFRALTLLERRGVLHRNIDDAIICRTTRVDNVIITLWWGWRRLDVIGDNLRILRFGPEGLMLSGHGALVHKTLVTLRRHMVLDDLASL
jgi:hypothetical protein